MAVLDHLILTVNDLEASVRFYTEVMGFAHEGQDGPFPVIRVSPETTLQLAPWGTEGGEHLAFALAPRSSRPLSAGCGRPGFPTATRSTTSATCGARATRPGPGAAGPTVYLFDPNGHLVESGTTEPESGCIGPRVDQAGGCTSSTVAEPMPPPAHSVPTPMPPPRRRSSWISVTRMRAPEQPTGCPMPTHRR